MKRFFLLSVMLIVSIVCIGCEKEKEPDKTYSGNLEGVIDYNYYYNEEGIHITNCDRIMYSDWENIEFDYVCTDPICMHTEDTCTSYAIDDEERREDRTTFTVEYDGKLVIFEKYSVSESEEIDEKTTKYNSKYYTDVYEAESDGSDRKLKVTIEGITESNVMFNCVIVHNGKVWFGGVKESETISELIKGDMGEGYFDEKTIHSDAVYSVDLSNYSVDEYVFEENKECSFDTVSFMTDKNNVYAVKQCFEENKISVYKIDSDNNVELLFIENEKDMFTIGLLGDRLYYATTENLFYRNLSDVNERHIFKVDEAENMLNSYIVGDLLAVLTACEWDGDIIKNCEYTFFDANGNEINKYSYDEYFAFFQVMGDRLIFTKPFSEKQMWWNNIDNIENIFEGAIYIGTFVGAEHDVVD